MRLADLFHSASQRFRSGRMALFERTMRYSPNTRILDVGGSPSIWAFSKIQPQVTFLNLEGALAMASRPAGRSVAGDGCSLPFADKSFDIVFSNSVIEHVGARENQRRFANEVLRVGKSYWVQTPNQRFPFELHTMMPLVHFLPKSTQKKLLNVFAPWELVVQPTKQERAWFIDHVLNDLNLLDEPAVRDLFPDAQLLKEPFFGLAKSIVAVGGRSA